VAQPPSDFTSSGAYCLWFGVTWRTVGGHGEDIRKDFETGSIHYAKFQA